MKKAVHQRIDAFELWCWRRLLRVPWTARRSNQSILKEISPDYSLEGLMLKLKLQYLGCLMRKTGSLEKTLMLGKIEDRRRRGRQRMRWLDAWCAAVHGVAKSWTRLSNWTQLTVLMGFPGSSVIKNLPAMQESLVRSLDQEDALEKGMAAHSSILASRIPWTEEPRGLCRVGHDWVTMSYNSHKVGDVFLVS